MRLVPKKKRIMAFFLVNFLPTFIDMHRMDTMLPLILLVSEMLNISRAKVEPRFFNKFAFVSNKCLAQDASRECPKTTENL